MIELQLSTARGVRAGKGMQTLRMDMPIESLDQVLNGSFDTSALKQQLQRTFAEVRQGDKAKLTATIEHPSCSATPKRVISAKRDVRAVQPASSRCVDSAKTRYQNRLDGFNPQAVCPFIPRSYHGEQLERSISVLNQNACNYIKQRVIALYDVAKQAAPIESPVILDASSEALIASKGLDNAKAYIAFRLLNQSSERNELGDLLSFNLPKLDKSLQLTTIAELKYVAQKFDAVLLRFIRHTRKSEILRQRALPFREQLSCKGLTADRSLVVFIREYVAARVSNMLLKLEQKKQAKPSTQLSIKAEAPKQEASCIGQLVAETKTELSNTTAEGKVTEVVKLKADPLLKSSTKATKAKILKPKAAEPSKPSVKETVTKVNTTQSRQFVSKTQSGQTEKSVVGKEDLSVNTPTKKVKGLT